MDDSVDRTLWVGNLPDKVTEEHLYELFLQSGPLERLKLVKKGRTNFAFVQFKHDISVPFTIDLMEGIRLYGNKLAMQFRPGSCHEAESRNRQNKMMNPNLPGRNFSPGMMGPPPGGLVPFMNSPGFSRTMSAPNMGGPLQMFGLMGAAPPGSFVGMAATGNSGPNSANSSREASPVRSSRDRSPVRDRNRDRYADRRGDRDSSRDRNYGDHHRSTSSDSRGRERDHNSSQHSRSRSGGGHPASPRESSQGNGRVSRFDQTPQTDWISQELQRQRGLTMQLPHPAQWQLMQQQQQMPWQQQQQHGFRKQF